MGVERRGAQIAPARSSYESTKFCRKDYSWLALPNDALSALLVTLLIPGTLLAVLPARQSRILVIHLRDSSDGILEMFTSAAIAAGLQCRRLDGWKNPGIQCLPNGGGHLGLVDAVDVTESKSVVISAFSSNVSTPHGELDPSVEAALIGFRRALDGNSKILRIDECAAPKYSGCLTK